MIINERDRPAIEKIILNFDENDWDEIVSDTERINKECKNDPLYLYPNLTNEFDPTLMDFASFDYDEQERANNSRWDYINNKVKYQRAIDIYLRSMEYQEAV